MTKVPEVLNKYKKVTPVLKAEIRSTEIRKQAEEVLLNKTTDLKKLSSGDAKSLIHELEVHQIELEMQNEELRKVQKELEDARNRYSDLYDFSPIGYFTFDEKGLILEVNLTGAKKLGRERAYLINMPFSLYIHDNKDAFYSHLREVFNTNKTQMILELRLVDNEGYIFDAKLESIPVHDSDGNLLCRTALSDITQRKRAEEAIREAEAKYRSIFENAVEGIFQTTIEGRFIEVNPAMAHMLGYESPQQLIDEVPDVRKIYLDPGHREELIRRLQAQTVEMELGFETTFRRRDGAEIISSLNVRANRNKDGKLVGFEGIALDITEKKRIEDALKESERRASEMFQKVQLAAVVLDVNGDIMFCNDFLLNISGWKREEVIGKNWFEMFIPFEQREEIRLVHNKAMAAGEPSHYENEILTKSGERRLVSFNSLFLRDPGGKVIGASSIGEDITERKRIENLSKEARLYAESIIDTVREPFVVLDKDLKVLSASRSFYSTFEVTADETVGNLIYDIGNRQWDIPSLRTLLEEILPKNTQFNNYEVSHKFQTIGQKIMRLNARQIYQEVIGTPIILLAIEDITERKLADKVFQEARLYAESIIDTVREPFVVLDKDLKVLSASRSFYSTFEVTPVETVGNLIYDIGNRQWDIPTLRTLLEEILPKETQFNNYEVSHKFQTIGQKIMLLNARQIYQEVIGKPIILLAIEDITQRKQADKVSQEARIYAESIIDTVREPFVVLDKDLKVLSANRSFYGTFEVTPVETVGNLIYDIGDRQWDIPSLRTLLEEILPKNTQFNNYEVSHKFQTIGQKIMLLNARQIIQEVIGTPIILLAIEDITERKLADKVFQEARIYAESIIDTVREPFVVLDKDLKVLSASRSFYSTFEVTADETVGNLIYDIGNRQWDIPSLRTLLEEILPKHTQFIDYEVSHKFQTIGQKIMLLNARQIYQEVIGTPIILLAIEDITQRRQVEKVSREARIYAESIIDTVREPFVVLDKDLKVLSANRSFYSTFEVTADETVGNLIYDIGNRQWDIPSLRTLLEEILPKDTQFNNYEVSHKFQTIGQKIMLLNARQIYQEEIGTPIILLAIEDITLRKKAEEKLKQTLEELERSNKDLEQFAYAASHDLQEPLRTVSNFSQLLAKQYKGELDAKADQFLGFIVDGTTRMQEMIDNLLAYSRITTLAKPFQPTNCETIFDQVLANVKMAIEESGAIVTHDPLPTVIADASQIGQVFQNLISNAIKFRKQKPHIMVSAVQKGNDWLFSVKDNGIGIAPDFMEHIFKMFQREHSTAQFPGTGIGLVISKKIVERHGGRIWVESQAGKGSTFYFTIPVRKGENEHEGNQ